jgi:proline utilization trans-activator
LSEPEEYELKDHRLRNTISEVSISATGKRRIIPIGPTDSLNLVGQLQDAMFGKGPVLEIGSDTSIYNRSALPTRRHSLPDTFPLPPYKVAKGYFAAQYTYIGTIFSFENPSTFDEQLQKALQGPPDLSDADECLAYAHVLIILAFGQIYSVNQWVSRVSMVYLGSSDFFPL